MNIGIIGFGGIGKQHFRALAGEESISKLHVYTPRINFPVEDFPNTYFHSSLQELLKHVDGVIIASPNHFHFDHILAALEKRLFVLCEKPLCCNDTELNLLQERIHNKSHFNISFNYRFLKITEAVQKFVKQEGINLIKSIQLKFYKDSAFRKPTVTWRESGESGLSSGAFGDLGVHLIDMMIYLFGAIPEKNGLNLSLKTNVTHKGSEKIMVDDAASLVGQLENLIKFEIITSKSCIPSEKGFEIMIKSENSTFHYHSSNPTFYFVNLNDKKQKFLLEPPSHSDPDSEIYGWSNSFFDQNRTWISKIKTGKESEKLATFSDAMICQRVFCDALETCKN